MKKKILSLALAVLMLLPMLSLCISAEAMHPTDDTTQSATYGTTVYVSNGATGDGLSESSPISDISEAAKLLPAEGGRILILDEAKIFGNRAIKVTSNSAVATGTVYIEGKKQADGSNAKLTFASSGKNLALFGTTVIHNLDITASVTGTHTISANGYNVTIGANVTQTDKVGGATINLIGGVGVTSSAATNLVEGGALTVYSGVWDNVSAASWAFGEASDYPSIPGVVNVYGGTITNLFSKRSNERLVNIESATINYYGGNVTTITGRTYDDDACVHTLNLYASTDATLAGVFEDGTGTINDYSTFNLPATFGTTVYVASAERGDADGSSADNAMAVHLQDAVSKLPAEGGRIVVLDDISVNFSTYNTLKVNGGSAIATGTVYIQGVKQEDGTYSKVSFGKDGDQYIRVFGTTVLFDIELEKATSGALWVSANAYDLTIGRNVSTSRAVDGATVSISGGVAGSSYGNDLSDTAESTKIYSGTWDAVHAASYNPGGGKPSTAVEVTLYGGTFTTVYSKRNHNNLTNIAGATINYYGGNVTKFTGERRGDDAATHTLNCYTAVVGSQLSGVFSENGDGVVNDLYSNPTVEYPEFVTPTDFTNITTVYVSYANGSDSNDGLTEQTAVKEIHSAAKKLPATGGRILIVDEAKLYTDRATKVTSSLTVATDTVYIEGMQQADGTYARLAFGAASKNLVLIGKTVIYNLAIYGTTAGTSTISADGYDVTIGTNVSLYDDNVEGSYVNLIGGIGTTSSSSTNLNSAGGTLTIYSGVWENVSAVSWAFGSDASNWMSAPGTVTVYGGTINKLYSKRSYARLINITSATVNYYAGDVNTFIGEEYTGDVCVHTLNLYSPIPTGSTISGVFAAGGTGTVNEIYLNQFIAPTIPDSMTTIYIAATARGEGDGSSADNAKSGLTLETAANLLPAEGGRIVIVEDMTIKFSATNSLKVTSSKTAPTGPIYIEGLDQGDGTYPQLSFNNDGDQYLRIFGTTVIYNLELNKSVRTADTTGELWISANGYDLTIGDTVTTSVADGCTINLTSGVGSSSHGADLSASPVATNVYGGTWNTVSAASWNPGSSNPATSAVINIYGGKITTLYTKRSHANLTNTVSATVNYYAGTVTTITGVYNSSDASTEHILNLYASTSAALTGVLAEANTDTLVGNEYLLEGTAPKFEVPTYMDFVGVQETAVDSTTDEYSVRFVAVLKESYKNVDELGFYIKANGSDWGKTNRLRVYNTIAGAAEGIPYTAAQLGGEAIFEIPMYSIPASIGMVTFEVQAYVVIEGVEYLDTAYNVVYNAGEYVTTTVAKSSLINLNLRKPQNTTETNDSTVGFDARAERIKDFIATNLPDSFGVQECNSDWYEYLNAKLAELGYVTANESVIATLSASDKLLAYDTSGWVLNNYVYYNKNTTDLIASGAVWLGDSTASETAVLSGRYFIGASWAILSDRVTGNQYVHISTHLNAASSAALGNAHDYRAEELACLMDFVNEKAEFAGLDIFITGDFNENMSGSEGTVYSSMTGDTYGYTDARKTAESTDQMNTYNASCEQFDADNKGTNTVTDRKIAAYTCKDYCFHSGDATISSFDVVNKWNGSYLSDHNALVVEFTLS